MSLTFERQSQKLKWTMGSDGRLDRAYDIGFLAKSDSLTELTVLDVLTGLGLTPGGLFGDDPTTSLGSVEIERLPTIPPHCKWEVTLNYSSQASVPQNDSPDPTQRRIAMDKGYRELSRTIIKDKDSKMIRNAAEQPMPVPIVDYPETYTYQWARNTPTKGFHKTINQNKFNGCDPFTLLCLIKSGLRYEGAFRFWEETIDMVYDPLGHKPKPVNAGFKQLKDGKLIDVTDGNSQPTTEAQPLYDADSGAGKPKGLMVPISDRPDGCTFVTVEYFTITDFAKIGVPEFPQ